MENIAPNTRTFEEMMLVLDKIITERAEEAKQRAEREAVQAKHFSKIMSRQMHSSERDMVLVLHQA